MNDRQLYFLCKKYGQATLMWRQRFTGLLPQVYQSKLYEKRGYSSIFEFAAKLAGLSQEQVRIALNLEKRLETLPILKRLFVEGTVSMNKLVRIISIATPENQTEWAEKVQILPKKALETLLRDEKQNGLFEAKMEAKSLPEPTLNFQISPELTVRLNHLHAQGHDVNQILTEALQQRDQRITEKKNLLAEAPSSSRPIRIAIRQVLKEEFGKKCAISTCKKRAEEIHHTRRWSIDQSHNPYYLAPLCHEHHQIAYAVDRKVQEKWRN